MKILKYIGGLLALLVCALVGMALMQPDHAHLARDRVIHATPADVFPYANDVRKWNEWDPFIKADPAIKLVYSENPVGKGAYYTWAGNGDVGSGKMTIVESTPDAKVVTELHFTAPMENTATATFEFTAQGDDTRVVWSYDAENNFIGKLASVVMDMDSMMGGMFEDGLDALAPKAEAAAKARKDAEAKAAAEAAAAAAQATAATPDVETAAATAAAAAR